MCLRNKMLLIAAGLSAVLSCKPRSNSSSIASTGWASMAKMCVETAKGCTNAECVKRALVVTELMSVEQLRAASKLTLALLLLREVNPNLELTGELVASVANEMGLRERENGVFEDANPEKSEKYLETKQKEAAKSFAENIRKNPVEGEKYFNETLKNAEDIRTEGNRAFEVGVSREKLGELGLGPSRSAKYLMDKAEAIAEMSPVKAAQLMGVAMLHVKDAALFGYKANEGALAPEFTEFFERAGRFVMRNGKNIGYTVPALIDLQLSATRAAEMLVAGGVNSQQVASKVVETVFAGSQQNFQAVRALSNAVELTALEANRAAHDIATRGLTQESTMQNRYREVRDRMLESTRRSFKETGVVESLAQRMVTEAVTVNEQTREVSVSPQQLDARFREVTNYVRERLPAAAREHLTPEKLRERAIREAGPRIRRA